MYQFTLNDKGNVIIINNTGTDRISVYIYINSETTYAISDYHH
jgi:hypothetical protein